MVKRVSSQNLSLYFTRHRATEQNLTGWVRNTDTNKVEGEAQGEESALATFLKHLDTGPSHARVVKLDKEDREVVEDETGFEIRR
ncbi:Acylphosphatase-like domain-containing protein [Chaetomium sp. MPI-SDFR-AT-0129]|nr:Acylphosphatase-like domain-containing protein [Chaetomium sp. MPI-SDFR-AT-0129]